MSSLLDALLLEEPTPPTTPTAHAFFVALRDDGQLGSGTKDDPWNGSTIRKEWTSASLSVGDEFSAAKLTWLAGTATAQVNTLVSHGLEIGDLVTVSGSLPAVFKGQFRVKTRTDTTFTFDVYPPTVTTPQTDASCSCRSAMLLVRTSRPHGYGDHSMVEISGVEGTEVLVNGFTFNNATSFNSLLVIQNVSATEFRCAIASFVHAPYGTSILCREVVFGFDRMLSALPVPPEATACAVHIGPGVFETRGVRGGWVDAAGARQGVWRAWPNQKFVGSGMDVTTLKVMVAGVPEGGYGALGGYDYDHLAPGSEVSDLTVDCNMAAHPPGTPYALLSKVAIGLIGAHVRMARVRCIDFGTHHPSIECFPLGTGRSHPYLPEVVNAVIDECIAEAPSINNIRETTCITNVGSLSAFQRGSVVRNCVLDGRYVPSGQTSIYQPLLKLERVSGSIFRITMREPHGRNVRDALRLVGVRDSIFVPSDAFDGYFQIVAVSSTTIDFRILTLPPDPDNVGNYFLNLAQIGTQFHGPGVDGGTAGVAHGNRVYHMTLGFNHDTWSSKDVLYANNYYANVSSGLSQLLGGGGIAGYDYGPSASSVLVKDNAKARFTCAGPHGLAIGNLIVISDAMIISQNGSLALSSQYNGSKTVLEVLDEFTFTYAVDWSSSLEDDQNAQGTPVFAFGGISKGGTVLKRVGDIATFTSFYAHRLLPGQAVFIENTEVNGNADPSFNGYFEVLDVPPFPKLQLGPTTFTYRLQTLPNGFTASNPPNSPNPPQWREYWRNRAVSFEQNIVESTQLSNQAKGAGINVVGGVSLDLAIPRATARYAARENIVRHFPGFTDGDFRVIGISTVACEAAVIQGNVIGLAAIDEYLLPELGNGRISFLANQRPDGANIRSLHSRNDGSPGDWNERLDDRIATCQFLTL